MPSMNPSDMSQQLSLRVRTTIRRDPNRKKPPGKMREPGGFVCSSFFIKTNEYRVLVVVEGSHNIQVFWYD